MTNKFDYENKHALFHFGIFNDYDGGLAFAPSAQSGDYLIMVNASDQQGDRHKTLPKTLYQEGRIIPELVNKKPVSRQRQMRSDVYMMKDIGTSLMNSLNILTKKSILC